MSNSASGLVPPRSRVDPLALVLRRQLPALALVAGLLLSLRLWILYRGLGVSLSLGDALGSGFMECAVWLPFLAPSLWCAQRFRAHSFGPARTIALHLAIGALVSLGYSSAFALVSSAFRSLRFGDAFVVHLPSALFSLFLPGLLSYALVVVGGWWWLERRETEERTPTPESTPARATIELRVGRKQLLLFTDEIEWIRAAGNYLEVHTSGGMHLVRETLAGLLERFDADEFLRVHRSSAVRESAIAAIEGHELILMNGSRLSVGRTYRDALLSSLRTLLADEARLSR